jgi:hypothetical protein
VFPVPFDCVFVLANDGTSDQFSCTKAGPLQSTRPFSLQPLLKDQRVWKNPSKY